MITLTHVILSIAAFLLVVGAVGVAMARRPLRRPGYWLRIGLQIAALFGINLVARRLDPLLLEVEADPELDLLIVAGLTSFALYAALFVFGFWLEGRRMLDAGYSRWWALLGAIPFAFIVFGVLPSRAPQALNPDVAAETFR